MLILAVALLAQTAPAAAPATDAGSAPAATKPRMVCRKIETTGSRVQSRRVCMSAKDWRGAGDQARAIKQGMSDLTSGGPPGS